VGGGERFLLLSFLPPCLTAHMRHQICTPVLSLPVPFPHQQLPYHDPTFIDCSTALLPYFYGFTPPRPPQPLPFLCDYRGHKRVRDVERVLSVEKLLSRRCTEVQKVQHCWFPEGEWREEPPESWGCGLSGD